MKRLFKESYDCLHVSIRKKNSHQKGITCRGQFYSSVNFSNSVHFGSLFYASLYTMQVHTSMHFKLL
jgi:hypothetical protein